MLLGTHASIDQLAVIYNVPTYDGKMIAELASYCDSYIAAGVGYTGKVLYITCPIGPMPLCYCDSAIASEVADALTDYLYPDLPKNPLSNAERIARAKARKGGK